MRPIPVDHILTQTERNEYYDERRSEQTMDEFKVYDSGQREQFPSGMQRDTGNKTRYDLVFDGPLLKRWAEHLTKGAEKYDARNWLKAATIEEMDRFRQSAVRHFIQWLNGETDEDHAAAVLFNINGYEYVHQRLAVLPTVGTG